MKRSGKINKSMSRRRFLTQCGLAAGCTTIPFPHRKNGPPASIRKKSASPLKVGVLCPASRFCPDMSSRFVDGLDACFSVFSHGGIRMTLEDIGTGTAAARETIGNFFRDSSIDVVTGLLGPKMVAELSGEINHTKKILLAAHVGEDVVRPGDFSPNVFHTSLNMWQANVALGAWAARSIGSRAVMLSSFHDSGYEAVYAFEMAYETAGGKIVDRQVLFSPGKGPDWLSGVRRARPDLLFGSFCGRQAVDFITDLKDYGLLQEMPLLGAGFTLDKPVIDRIGTLSGDFFSASGRPDPLAPKFRSFLPPGSQYLKYSDSPFFLLGWETAQLLLTGFTAKNGDIRRIGALIAALESAVFNSPRGIVRMDPATHCLAGPVSLFRIGQTEQGPSKIKITDVREHNIEKKLAAPQKGPVSGWTNSFLCV